MLMGLAGEVSVMRDRMDTVERLLGEKGLLTQSDIDNFVPSEDVLMQRAETRDLFWGDHQSHHLRTGGLRLRQR